MNPRPVLTPGVFTAMLLVMLFVAAPSRAQETFELGSEGFRKIAEPKPGTPEAELLAIRKKIAAGEGENAADMAKEWIKQRPNHPLLPEAYLLKGDARVSYGKYYKALYDYEFLIRSYPDSEYFHLALEREMVIAEAFGRGVKRHILGMRILPADSEAEELYIRIQERAPGSKIAERAGVELADFYYRRSEMFLAAEAYRLFIQNYPNSQWREHAMKNEILANLATFKGPRFDATGLTEAQLRLKDYQQDFPAAAEQFGAQGFITRVDESLAARTFLVAQWYESRKKWVPAAVTYRQVIKQHPGSSAAQKAMLRLEKLETEKFPAGLPQQLRNAESQPLPPAGKRVGTEIPTAPKTRERAQDGTEVPKPAQPTDAPESPIKK